MGRQPSILTIRPIPNWPGYFITKHGEVYSNKSPHIKPLSIKTARLMSSGYLKVQFGRKWLSISRLVALTYIPNPHNYPIVLHKDNNPLNNYYKNLAWGTYKMNNDQILKDGRRALGNKHSNTKYSVKTCETIISLHLKSKTVSFISQSLGISWGQTKQIILGKTHNSKIAWQGFPQYT